jgi:exodeoxyribonuclease V alpha subunit
MVLSDKRGEGRTGTSLLNQVIREQIFGIRTRDYKEGDIIIAVRNDYETHGAFFKNRAIERYTRTIRHKDRPTIFNGSVGVIKEIDEANASVLIEYINPRVEARYNLEELDWYIEHGYAITVHKAQGGQAKYVIFAALEPDKISREMLYTALTRSQDKVYLVGGTKAAWQAGKKQQYVLTKLKYKILQELEGKLEESKKTAGSRVRLVE